MDCEGRCYGSVTNDMPFHKVIQKYGYPVVSKTVAMAINRYRNTKSMDQKLYRLHGKWVDGKHLTAGTIPKKWQYLILAPFKNRIRYY